MDFKALLVIIISSVLVNNYVLSQTLGICPFLGVSKKTDQAVGMGLSVTVVMLIATLVTWPVQHYVLNKFDLAYLQTIVFILIIAALVQVLEIFLKKFSPALHRGLGVYLPLITTNCAVLGVAINNIKQNYTFLESLVNSFAAGVGFLLAMVLFAGVRSRIDETKVPRPFRGVAIALIAASILSLAFMGFSGMVK